MIKKVIKYINENKMIDKGDIVIVAVSGGPDSICLLHLLNNLKETYNIEIKVAHINHCFRGEESDRDELFVEFFCRNADIPFFSKRIDVHKYANENNLSDEAAGREVRYTFFEELKIKLKAQKIALAHNANDQAETILMRIMRGTGIDGLKGIKAVRDNVFIRPLLIIPREEIENYCLENSLNTRTDSSNLLNIYKRNKIRLELIPYIQNNFNTDIVNTLNRLSTMLYADSSFLEELTEEKYKLYCYDKEDRVIINKECFKEKEAILSRIIRKAIMEKKGDLANIETIHVYDIISLHGKGTGKSIMLPEGLMAENVYGDMHISINKHIEPLKHNDNIHISRDEIVKNGHENKIEIATMNICLQFDIISERKKIDFAGENLTKYFDYNKIKSDIIIRTRNYGDKFLPFGMKGSKKLKDYFMDLKIHKELRDKIPLLCFGEDIAWIIGYRVSEQFRVDNNTEKILKVRVTLGSI